MKHRITRIAPHQNAKTWAILSAVISLIFVVPIFLFGMMFSPSGQGLPIWGILVAPIIYLIFTYIVWVIFCAIYNVLIPVTGGFEYDSNQP